MQGKVTTEDAMAPVYGGIDVCKERLDVYLHPLGKQFSVANDCGGWRRLLRRLAEHRVAAVVMEPTSKYHRAAHRHLDAAGIAVALIAPHRARLFAGACGQLAKTDRIDARILALAGERLDPAVASPPTAEEEALEELAGARAAAVAERTATSNRLRTTTSAFLRRELGNRLRGLDRHLERIEARIVAMIATNARLARQAAIIRSIPGMGPVNVLAILTGLREIGRITGKQAAALAGLAPFADDSGHRQGQRRIRGGRAALRRALYMAAVAASRCNPELKAFYQRLRAKGKSAKAALIAVARKLIVLANTLVGENRTWTSARP
ncbi:MAG TPA: IS110 family transposase [Allosphingosinicella sp.]|nr:IS110 family transposase [Allosphingosinicella sp.]